MFKNNSINPNTFPQLPHDYSHILIRLESIFRLNGKANCFIAFCLPTTFFFVEANN